MTETSGSLRLKAGLAGVPGQRLHKIRSRRFPRWLVILFVLIVAMPVRLWLSWSTFRTLTLLDITIWALAVGLLALSGSRRLTIGSRPIFVALCVPVMVAAVSLVWSVDPLSTIKMVFYSTTSLLGYWVTVNVFKGFSSRFIANCMALFLLIVMSFAILYWLRVPFIWSLSGDSLKDVEGLDSFYYASRFARLDHPYLGRSNDFASTLVLYVPFFVGVVGITSNRKYAVFAFLAALGVMLTLSRGVVLAMAFALGVILLAKPSLSRVLGTVVAVSLLIIPVYWFTEQTLEAGIDILDLRLRDSSEVYARIDRFDFGRRLIEQSPLLGKGGGRFLSKNVAEIDSALHNTYLEQLAAYGVVLGTIVILSLLSLPWSLFRWRTKSRHVRTAAHFASLSTVAFLLACFTQTANESAIPSLMFRIFLGSCVAYLCALENEQSEAQALPSRKRSGGKNLRQKRRRLIPADGRGTGRGRAIQDIASLQAQDSAHR